MRSRRIAVMTLGGVLSGYQVASDAQSSAAEARKPYVRCAAVFAASFYVSEDKRQRDMYTDKSMLLATWATELDNSVPAKQSVDLVTREFGDAVVQFGERIKKAKEQPSTAAQFRSDLNAELQSCETFWDGARVRHTKPR